MSEQLAPYSSFPENSRGRLYPEGDIGKYRSLYGKDRERIIHCNAFRRLQYKTQVFVNHQGDHYRTRLTHSLEVAQIARWIASGLQVNKDLAEVVALAHDLGHPPFGHAGERALNNKTQEFEGFSHNAHTLKIITKLEKRHVEFDGLNLSWEMLEGVVKHNGSLARNLKTHPYIWEYNAKHDLDLSKSPALEAQISAIADDIAYNAHDIEDGLRADLFSVEQLLELYFVGSKFKKILDAYPRIERELLVSEAQRQIINDLVIDVIETTKNNLKQQAINSSRDVRNYPHFLVHFSENMERAHQELKKFLLNNMYRHYKINRMTANACRIVGGLFDFFMNNPDCLPSKQRSQCETVNDKKELAGLIADYIAGMTDRFAIKEFQELML